MKEFDQNTLEEKIMIINEDGKATKNSRWNQDIKIKLLVVLPILSFVLITFIQKYKDGFMSILSMLAIAFVCISLGVLLYSRTLR